MNRISVREILKAVKGTLLCGDESEYVTAVKHDSRECAAGDLFVAIEGENHDGHQYIPQVMEKGCRALLVSHGGQWLESAEKSGAAVIMVEDTVYSLGELAKFYLSTLSVKKIAVTGSVGKTSVRDIIYYVLREKYNCGRNVKNFNNLIGLPLSIFNFDKDMEAVVLEMGMSEFGEIDRLAEIVKPNIAVITNIGVSHIESLGSREGIFRAKMEVSKHITPYEGQEGTLVFVNDGEYLTRERTKGNYRQISIGENGKSDYIISDVDDFGLDGIKFSLEHFHRRREMRLPVPGRHSAVNGAIAAAVGELSGMSGEEIQQGFENVVLTGSRLKQLKNDRVMVIDDTYNASPDSMKSALKVLESSGGKARKIAVLGDMYELGDESGRQHFAVGVFARALNIDALIAIGQEARGIYEGASGSNLKTAYYEKKEDFYKDIDDFIKDGDIILVKGSRGMKMEQVVENILKH